jgi:ribosomal protein L37AE/L43A
MTTLDNEIKQKLSKKFSCKKCDYNTDRKSNLENHLLSSKHIKTTNDNEIKQKLSTHHKCENCEKEYNDRAGLWRHKKKCNLSNNNNNMPENIENKEILLSNTDITDKGLILTLIQQNNELQKQMLEVLKNSTTNNTINNNNSHNKTFNLQVFLNETCKDAMNIMDFVDSIKIQLADVESIGELGFVNGISKLIIKNLKALDENMRPVHCNDSKRETMYVKDGNVWEKEDSDNKKMRKAIKYIAHKNICALPLWKAKYPDHSNSESKRSDQYNYIMMEAMGGAGDNDEEKAEKIIKKISKEVLISKT